MYCGELTLEFGFSTVTLFRFAFESIILSYRCFTLSTSPVSTSCFELLRIEPR